MKLFFSEFPANYSKYHFPYQVLMQLEKGDDLARVYHSGFLPFRSKKDWFYMARSTRVKLGQFQPSSENRRIIRKVDYLTYSVQPVEQFEYTDKVQKLCAEFSRSLGESMINQGAANENESKPIPTSAIRKLFTGQSNTTHIMTFIDTQNHQIAGYTAIVAHENLIHYAHPFLDINIEDKNLNIGMMTLAVQWAFDQHKQHIFLGTCYTPGSLYKTQFTGFEFFNGITWSNNLDELKYLIQRNTDTYLMQDKVYIKDFEMDLEKLDLEEVAMRIKFK